MYSRSPRGTRRGRGSGRGRGRGIGMGREERPTGSNIGGEPEWRPDTNLPFEHGAYARQTVLGKRPRGGDSDQRDRVESANIKESEVVAPPERIDVSPSEKKGRLDEASSSSFAQEDSSISEEGTFKVDKVGTAIHENREPSREHRQSLLEVISVRDMKTINQNMIHAHRNGRQYFCVLCTAKLTTAESLLKHVVAMEHERRARMYFNWSKNKERHPFFCEVCVASCTCEAMLADHLLGKKHAKAFGQMECMQSGEYSPISPQWLNKLMSGPPVKKVGDGITLGLSPTMMQFFSLPGPFIGLKYAEEIGKEGDPNPRYFCHLCKVHMDFSNVGLHFTSTAHRHIVLSQDYHNKLANSPPAIGDKKDTERYARLAAEIESQEGRKVELIKRKILKGDWKTEPSLSGPSGGGKGRGGSDSRGRGRGGSDSKGRGRYEVRSGSGGMEECGGNFGQEDRGGFGQGGWGRGRVGQGGFGQGGWGRGRVGQGGFGQGGWGRGRVGQGGFGQRGRGKGTGDFGQRGRGGQSGRGRGAGGGRGGREWDNVLSKAYGGYSSYGNRGSGRGAKTWRERGSSSSISDYQDDSGDYDNSFRGSSHGNHGDGGSSDYCKSEEPEYDSSSQKRWQGNTQSGWAGRGRGRGRGRGGYHQEYSRETFSATPAKPAWDSLSDQASWSSQRDPQNWSSQDSGSGGHSESLLRSSGMPPPRTSFGSDSQQAPVHPSHSNPVETRDGLRPHQLPSVEQAGPSRAQVSNLPRSEIFRNLAMSSIETEEDAEMALQLSSTLTQALLAYRLKNVSTTNPLNEVLNVVQGTTLPVTEHLGATQPPQTHPPL